LHSVSDPAAAAARALKAVDLEEAQDRAVGEYSKGMRQRCKVAAAIVHEPEVLLLDEPFNGADPYQRLRMMEFLRRMAAQGWAILFSSHILEEVERLAENVLVIVSGRLAAAGNYHEIRKLMSDRPHQFTIRSSDDRRLAVALIGEACVAGVKVNGDQIEVMSSDFAAFTRVAPQVARRADVVLYEFRPEDESLESVFSYLVNR
jgi:ABC-2 type transport system ATP-binding protein